ncbi:MAG: 30S ribosomal protein S6 [Bacillota bacterium]
MEPLRKYELMYITRPDLDEESLKNNREKVQSVITQNGGKILETQDMGKRRLAYPIQRLREGVYTVVQFQSEGDIVKELERNLRLDDNVIRHMVIRIDER